MALKPRTRNRILFGIIAFIGLVIMAVVTIPPMITLNSMRGDLETAISHIAGTDVKINGRIGFSLLGHATIVARDVTVPTGHIGSVMFRVPYSAIFDMSRARPTGRIDVYDANVEITRLIPVPMHNDIGLHNVNVEFLGKDYTIVDGNMTGGELRARVRTNQHKYDITLMGDEFHVANKTNNLVIIGRLTPAGGATGSISLQTDDINAMFEFTEPKIETSIDVAMKFEWDGQYGFKFTDIRGNGFTGNIELNPNGYRNIQIKSSDATFDFSFLLAPTRIMYETSFDLDLRGHLRIGGREFSHLILRVDGTDDALKINQIIADDVILSGGEITADGANNVLMIMPFDGARAVCRFSGTPTKWKCERFSYEKMHGSISVDRDMFDITVKSDEPMPDESKIRKWASQIGRGGTINFLFPNAAGTMTIDGRDIDSDYKFTRGKTVEWMGDKWNFLPESMRNATGDVSISGTRMTFRPTHAQWEMTVDGNAFAINGKTIRDWLPNIDLRVINDGEYFISGLRGRDAISNLTIRFGGYEFTGRASGDTITLSTDTLNIDTFVAQSYIDNYDELQFLTNAPIMMPFDIGLNISLHADTLIYNGTQYNDFTYRLNGDTQSYSISDNARGGILATIQKSRRTYDIKIGFRRFHIDGAILPATAPVNIYDATITGEINMQTSGAIAHDLEHNLAGNIDLSVDDGYIDGIGIDDFYAAADSLTTLNAEYAIANALDGGTTKIKEMHIAGTYSHGNFETTTPMTISMRHADLVGMMEIVNNALSADMDLTLRATSPAPTPIALRIAPDGTREYSLSEIMTNFDASYMRQFIATHDRF